MNNFVARYLDFQKYQMICCKNDGKPSKFMMADFLEVNIIMFFVRSKVIFNFDDVFNDFHFDKTCQCFL